MLPTLAGCCLAVLGWRIVLRSHLSILQYSANCERMTATDSQANQSGDHGPEKISLGEAAQRPGLSEKMKESGVPQSASPIEKCACVDDENATRTGMFEKSVLGLSS